MLYMTFFLIFSCTGMLCSNCYAQEPAGKEDEAFHPYHQIALVISHAQVFEGRDIEGNKKVLSLPSWGIDYTYRFHPKWAIGLHTDIIVEKFEVEKHLESGGEGEVLERSYPVAPAFMGIYKATEHWSFLLGIGGEFAKEENFALTRAGIEYGSKLPKGWEVFGALNYDFKWTAYDTWTIGIGIAKKLGKKKHD
jgi:hypothetical protein